MKKSVSLLVKKRIFFVVSILIVVISNSAFSQTADEIISRYLDAIGGKDKLNNLSSLYIEEKAVLGDRDISLRTTVLNGKGYKSELDLGGGIVLTECFTESGGWSINPITGNNTAATMPVAQYNLGKHQIYIGAPFTKYKELGYNAEVIKNESVGNINTVKIKLTSSENVSSFHYFDLTTGYLIKTVRKDEALGQSVESTISYSDYREYDGYKFPYKTTINMGGMYEISGLISKVEVNKPLDLSFFAKPSAESSRATTTKVQNIYKPIYKENVPVCNCEDLTKVTIPDTKIESAVLEPRDSSCRVTAIVNHPPFNDRVTVTIALPLRNWNGRFEGVGGGGFTGGMVYALNQPVSQGFAAGVTDGGHSGGSGSFAYNQLEKRLDWQSIRNFSHIAIHDMTVIGKTLVKVFYGKPAKYSYFVGGSNGGRQAMEEVQRYPEDYNGVLAMCPAVYWNHFLLGFLWPQAVMNDTKNFVSKQKLIAVTEAAIAACDGDDGLVDGVINDPMNCTWDPKLFVGTKVGESVFTEADANVVRKIWEGPRGYNSRFLWFGLTRGTYLYDYATTKGDPLTGAPNILGIEWAQYFLLQNPQWDAKTITCAEFEALFNQSVDQYSSLFETSKTDLSRFRDNGSKLIITQGLADNLIPPQGIIKYYNLLMEEMGGAKATAKFARLFLFPGLDHGFMGPGPKPVDVFSELVKWVEEGKAPKYIVAEVKNDSGEVIRKKSIFPYKN